MTRILVADDDLHNRQMLELLLMKYGFEVTVASNGVEALRLGRKNPPDLLVTDILMPVMDGFALCKQWKADKNLKRIPLVYYTAAYTDQKDEQFALSLGAAGFIIKPQYPSRLIEMLVHILEQSKASPPPSAEPPLGEEMEFFRQHNEALFRRLENKMVELGQANQALEREIEERRRTEEKLKTTNKRLSEAQRIARIGSWERRIGTDELQWSDETFRILGYAPHEIAPSFQVFLQAVHPEDREHFEKAMNAACGEGRAISAYYRLVRRDGATIAVHVQGEVMPDNEGRPVGLSGTIMDVTEQKLADDQLRASLEEKELLLRELSHRTKNNMNVIVSLIDLQAASSADDRMVQLFEDMKYRIMAMALVHEKLYRSQKLSSVNMRQYLSDLADTLIKGYRVHGGNVEVVVDVDDIYLSIDSVTPLGLVVNELMSNSMKYAFPDNRAGEIRISGRETDGEGIELRFCDNGVGFPGGADMRRRASLGLRLVYSLIELQMKGSIELDTTAGTAYTIRFKEPRRRQRPLP